jgi:hypothetical protein
MKSVKEYDPASPMLCDRLRDGDSVAVRSVKSNRLELLPLTD